METFGLHKFELIILISVISFVEIRADSFSVLDALFEGISVRLDNMEQSFENRLDNVMNDVNKRLVRLENKVGISGSSSDINGQSVDPGPETADLILDLNESKRRLLKAMSIEKQILRESMHEYVDKWNGFKEDVIAALGEMNSTLEIQRINSEASKELVTIGERIDAIDDNVVALNIKQDDQAEQIKTMDSLINELNRITESTEASLNYVTERVDKLSNDQSGKIKSIDSRIKELSESTEASLISVTDSISKLNGITESTEASLNYVTDRVDKLSNDQSGKIKNIDSRIKELSDITESTEASLISVTDRTNKMHDDHANKIKNINSRISELNRITESTEASLISVTDSISKLNGTKHAFSAYFSTSKKYNEGDIMVFDNIYRNTGYYNKRTGIFTVPKAGQYLISISVEGTHTSRAYAQIAFKQDGRFWYGASAFAEKGQDATASATFIYYFEKGNTVWSRSNGDFEFYHHRTSFTGVLLD
ncbi:hypothetical protein ACF0H5_010402 [Mactra antiquata]